VSGADVALIRRVYELWNENELDAMFELVDPRIVWRPGRDSPFAGLHAGRDSYEQYVRSWANLFVYIRVDLGEIHSHGEWLMAEQRQVSRMRGSDVDLEAVVTHVWRVADGKLVRWFSFRDEQEAREFLDGYPAAERIGIVRRAYEALNRGDVEAALEFVHPDIEWHTYIVPGPGGAMYRGHDGVRELWADAQRIFGDFRNVPEEVFEAGDHVIAHVCIEGTGTRSGAAVQARIAHLYSFRDALIVSVRSFDDHDDARRAAGLT
jgi:ketosteroid isomerase-like protein